MNVILLSSYNLFIICSNIRGNALFCKTQSRNLDESPAILPRAQIDCSTKLIFSLFNNSTKAGIAPLSTTYCVC